MYKEFSGIAWDAFLNSIPIPAAVLDADGEFESVNVAMLRDVGEAESPRTEIVERWRLARATGRAVLFGSNRYLWIMIPALESEGSLLIGIEASSTGHEGLLGNGESSESVIRTIRAQLAAIAGLAGSLQASLSGTGREQAAMIEQNSRLVLREIQSLKVPSHVSN